MSRSTTYLLFAAMSLIWGLTWIAIKIGIASVPPLFFAGTRFVAAGVLLLAWTQAAAPGSGGAAIRVRREDWTAMATASVLVIVGTYSLLFWGMRSVASGLAAVINLSLMPVALFVIGLAHREEAFSGRRAIAIAIGVAGLAILFRPTGIGRSGGEALGMAAIVGGTIAYSWGSVLSRPLLRRYAPEAFSGWTCLLGGVVLVAMSLALEPIDGATLAALATPAVAASWLFLVLFGSLVAYTFYMRLVRDWGASRAGLYCFVSPVIAVLTGLLASGEQLRVSELAGMVLMLMATWFALGRPARTAAAE